MKQVTKDVCFKRNGFELNKVMVTIASCLSLVAGEAAFAETTIKFDDVRSLTIGAGLRTSFNSVEDGAANGSSRSKDFTLDNLRLYLNGRVTKNIELEFNTERDTVRDEIRVLDAVAKINFSDLINVRVGRMVMPLDRNNLNGPFFMNGWDYPIASAWPAIFQGRDDGMVVWGHSGGKGGHFKYYAGAFQGAHASGAGAANQKDKLAYVGRISYNFWDPEPGYYTASTYYGTQDTLAIGVAAMQQSQSTGTAGNSGDFKGWSIDALMEKKLSNSDVVTLEASYFDFDLDNRAWSVSAGEFPATQGDGYFAFAGYMFGDKVGEGNFRPFVRFESFKADQASPIFTLGKTDKRTLGVDYIISGHNARISMVVGDTDIEGQGRNNFFRTGLQLQF